VTTASGVRPGWQPVFAAIFEFYKQGRIKPAAGQVFSLDQAGEALAAVRDRRLAGRCVLRLRDD
jgi:D-arabinose 1-dehydrogenase-like Zn-dependent alcohol dehydrogenase